MPLKKWKMNTSTLNSLGTSRDIIMNILYYIIL